MRARAQVYYRCRAAFEQGFDQVIREAQKRLSGDLWAKAMGLDFGDGVDVWAEAERENDL